MATPSLTAPAGRPDNDQVNLGNPSVNPGLIDWDFDLEAVAEAHLQRPPQNSVNENSQSSAACDGDFETYASREDFINDWINCPSGNDYALEAAILRDMHAQNADGLSSVVETNLMGLGPVGSLVGVGLASARLLGPGSSNDEDNIPESLREAMRRNDEEIANWDASNSAAETLRLLTDQNTAPFI